MAGTGQHRSRRGNSGVAAQSEALTHKLEWIFFFFKKSTRHHSAWLLIVHF